MTGRKHRGREEPASCVLGAGVAGGRMAGGSPRGPESAAERGRVGTAASAGGTRAPCLQACRQSTRRPEPDLG